jgi:two-component system nitrate/nitrite response regulator NarL
MNTIPIVLIDPNKLFRQGLKALLAGGDLRIVGECSTPREAQSLANPEAGVRLVLCDPTAGAGVQETVGELRSIFPGAQVVMLTGTMDPQAMISAIQAGVDGCLVKDISPDALVQSLRLVLMGEKVFPTELAALLVSGRFQGSEAAVPASRKGLSPREVEILQRLVDGDSNKMIANRLGITEATVKVHLKSLLRKISASNRTQAAIWALNNGMGENGRIAAAVR